MWRQLPWMMLTGLGLSSVFAAYSLLITPALKPPDMPRESHLPTQSADTQRPAENVRVAATWLNEESPWAAEAKCQLRTDEMFLYTDKWTPNGKNKQVEFRPFAAVWISHNKDGREQALTVTAESALLGFEFPFEEDNPRPGRVTGGSMLGGVRIAGPDGLEILGDAFFFSEATQNVWSQSNEPIQFRFGPNHGEAQKLNMQLLKGDKPVVKDRPNIVGIESIELTKIYKMDLLLRNAREEVPVHIKCPRGSFTYQVESRTAVFERDVLAWRVVDGDKSKADSLACDRLTVAFEPKDPPPAPDQAEGGAKQKSTEEFRRVETNLQFRSLKAEGKVILVSQKNELHSTMKTLTYEAGRRTVVLSAPVADDETRRGVVVTQGQGQSQVQCPEIELTLGDGETLKEVICRGVGRFRSRDPKSGEVAFAADWLKQLRKFSDPATQLDVIELEQDATFRQSTEETALFANVIRLWLTPLAGSTAGEFSLVGQPADAKPKRLLATGQVAMVHPKFEAEANHLEVLFDDSASPGRPRNSAKAAPSRPLRQSLGQLSKASPRRSMIQGPQGSRKTFALAGKPPVPPLAAAFASVPPQSPPLEKDRKSEEDLPAFLRDKPTSEKSRNERSIPSAEGAEPDEMDEESPRPPLVVMADSIRVRMLQRPEQDQPEVAEIWTTGRVQVEQASASGGKPLIVTGARLDVQQNSETDQVVNVYGEPGRPAHIRDEEQQLHIEGPAIHLRRGENLAWVEGPGLLQLPVPKSLDGKDLTEPQLLDVWWQKDMDFDGLLASFEGNVRAKLDTATMQCQSMQVTLSERLHFTSQENLQSTPEVKSVFCRDGVEFENKVYEEGKLMEIQRAKVFEFELDQVADTTTARGPGSMQMWRRGNGKRAGLAISDTVQANHVQREPSAEWEYTRVEFAKKMTGRIQRRQTAFHERVVVLYGPVERPLDVFSRHKLPKYGGYIEADKLDVVQRPGDDGGKSFVELLAAGNSRIESNEFSGRSDEISFDQSKGLYILRSFGDRKATIWQQVVAGLPPRDLNAQRIEATPAAGKYSSSKTTGGGGSQ